MAFPFPRSRDSFNQLVNKCFPPSQAQALRAAFNSEAAVKDATTARASTATLAADPDLSVDVIAGVPYRIKAVLYVTTGATPGIQIDQAGGTAVASNYQGKSVFATAAGASQVVVDVAALNTTQSPTAAAYVRIEHEAEGVFSTGGTLTLNWSQKASNATAAQVLLGSYLIAEPLTCLYSR
jgi:hypothetical protein